MDAYRFELKKISKKAIPKALERAERYRLLNEPSQAQSICHDILAVDPDNQAALITLILALTDRLSRSFFLSDQKPEDFLPRLAKEYDRHYYAGIISERQAKTKLDHGSQYERYAAYYLLRDAMAAYEKAESLRESGNDDATLRWNACARIIMQNKLVPKPSDPAEERLE